jgi:hypothetical protein
LRKDKRREWGETAKENEDRPDGDLPKMYWLANAGGSSWNLGTMAKKRLRMGTSKLEKELRSS